MLSEKQESFSLDISQHRIVAPRKGAAEDQLGGCSEPQCSSLQAKTICALVSVEGPGKEHHCFFWHTWGDFCYPFGLTEIGLSLRRFFSTWLGCGQVGLRMLQESWTPRVKEVSNFGRWLAEVKCLLVFKKCFLKA